MVAIATDFSVWDTCTLYWAHWSVESTFASLKVRGLDLKRIGITRPDRLERRFWQLKLSRRVSCGGPEAAVATVFP